MLLHQKAFFLYNTVCFISINVFTVPCLPGSFSPSGLAPCTLCNRTSFQPRAESRECVLCTGTTITLKPGSKKEHDCIGKWSKQNGTNGDMEYICKSVHVYIQSLASLLVVKVNSLGETIKQNA